MSDTDKIIDMLLSDWTREVAINMFSGGKQISEFMRLNKGALIEKCYAATLEFIMSCKDTPLIHETPYEKLRIALELSSGRVNWSWALREIQSRVHTIPLQWIHHIYTSKYLFIQHTSPIPRLVCVEKLNAQFYFDYQVSRQRRMQVRCDFQDASPYSLHTDCSVSYRDPKCDLLFTQHQVFDALKSCHIDYLPVIGICHEFGGSLDDLAALLPFAAANPKIPGTYELIDLHLRALGLESSRGTKEMERKYTRLR